MLFIIKLYSIRRFLDWWKKGDVEAEINPEGFIEQWMIENKESAQNQSNRNQDMSENAILIMQNLKQRKEILFIGVGASHLSGKDGIISKFREAHLDVIKIS